ARSEPPLCPHAQGLARLSGDTAAAGRYGLASPGGARSRSGPRAGKVGHIPRSRREPAGDGTRSGRPGLLPRLDASTSSGAVRRNGANRPPLVARGLYPAAGVARRRVSRLVISFSPLPSPARGEGRGEKELCPVRRLRSAFPYREHSGLWEMSDARA